MGAPSSAEGPLTHLGGVLILWMVAKFISHHFETVGIYRQIIILGFSSIHSMAVVVKTNGTPGEHQSRWYMGVHPPQNGGIGYHQNRFGIPFWIHHPF